MILPLGEDSPVERGALSGKPRTPRPLDAARAMYQSIPRTGRNGLAAPHLLHGDPEEHGAEGRRIARAKGLGDERPEQLQRPLPRLALRSCALRIDEVEAAVRKDAAAQP